MTDKPDIVERAKEDLGLAYKAFEFLGSSAPAEFDNLLVDVSELLSAIEALRANINRLTSNPADQQVEEATSERNKFSQMLVTTQIENARLKAKLDYMRVHFGWPKDD